MIRVILLLVLFAGIVLSVGHSFVIIRRGKAADALVNDIVNARREKGIFIFSLGMAFLYAFTILFLSIFWSGLAAWIAFGPVVYLGLWGVLRLMVRVL